MKHIPNAIIKLEIHIEEDLHRQTFLRTYRLYIVVVTL